MFVVEGRKEGRIEGRREEGVIEGEKNRKIEEEE